MRRVLMAAVGATFTGLVLVLPAAHAVRWSHLQLEPWLLGAAALPVLALLASLWGTQPAIPILAYPVAHLPALVLSPELTGPRVYGGSQGMGALAAVAVVGAAWFAVILAPAGPLTRRERSPLLPHPFGLGALGLALAIYGVFAHAAFSGGVEEPWSMSLSLVVGVLSVWYAVGHLFVGRLGDVLFDRDARARYVAGLHAVGRRNRASRGPRLP